MNSQTEVDASRLNEDCPATRSDIIALTGAVYFLIAAVLLAALFAFTSSLDVQLQADETSRSIARWIMGSVLVAGGFGGYTMWVAKRLASSN